MTRMCIDSKTWSISFAQTAREDTHKHAMHISGLYPGNKRETEKYIHKSIWLLFSSYDQSRSRMTCCFLLPRDLSVHYPPPPTTPPFLRLSEDLTYGPTLHPMCIYHPCLFVYVYITTVKSAVIMEKSPTDEIPFPPQNTTFFWVGTLFPFLSSFFVFRSD